MSVIDNSMLKSFFDEENNSLHIKQSTLTNFKSLDYLYLWTNELLKEYYEKNLSGKKVLTITSSADHLLHAALAQAKEIHSFDINLFSKYFSSLKLNMIINLDYEDFYKQMLYLSNNRLDIVLDKVGDFLPLNVSSFWQEYFRLYTIYNKSIFINGQNYSPKNNAYYTYDEYYNTKNGLRKANIIYHDVAIENLKKECLNDTYDVIYISNILGRIERCYSKVNEVAAELINNLKDMLNENGKIYDYALNLGMHECYKDEEVEKSYKIQCKLIKPTKDIVYIYTKKSNQNVI